MNDATEELSTSVLDGAGRVRAVSAELPNSVGRYVGSYTVYNSMGLVTQQSNPTEVDATWAPQGDDALGWVVTLQSYDWKGRPWITTNPDGWTRENTYGGCGCAGGEVVTRKDEAGRRRRTTMDSLGRLAEVEELNSHQSVYATTTYVYNARDQITAITQQNDRVRSFTYDGHGHLQSQTTP